MRVVAPALALGNAVVLKPDPQTPVVGGAMFEAVFREAGLPEGLLQVVVGGADVGEALVTDPNIPVVSFTGSTAVGRRVGQLPGAGQRSFRQVLRNAPGVAGDAEAECDEDDARRGVEAPRTVPRASRGAATTTA